jgi:prevent-host-death family protein
VADFVGDVCLTGRPLLITQHGRGVVVVIDVREFEAMRRRLEELEQAVGSGGQQPAVDGERRKKIN